MNAIFLDRDDTLVIDTPDFCIDSTDKIQLFPDTISSLRLFAELGYKVVIVTNQEVISQGRISEDDFWRIHQSILELLKPSGITILKTCMCPHTAEDNCECRKPKPFMIQQAAKEFGIELANSWMIGDRDTDVLAGNSAGAKTILVQSGKLPVTGQNATHVATNLLQAANLIAASV
jgi:D-glycero-D-manno-heptose 1,7-bisphosphate phosphatase